MAQFTTGLIDNAAASGTQPTSTLVIRISNDSAGPISVVITGYHVSGLTKTKYVEEMPTIQAGDILTRSYYAQFPAFEFLFATAGDAPGLAVSAWGKNASGNLVTAHRVLPAEWYQVDFVKGLSSFAYIFNSSAEVVLPGDPVIFSDNGVISGPISHTPGSGSVILGRAGQYAIWYDVASPQPNQFTLFRNDTPIPGSRYAAGGPNVPNPGMVIVTAAAGDIITLRNDSGLTPVVLEVVSGGTIPTTNASLLIEQIRG